MPATEDCDVRADVDRCAERAGVPAEEPASGLAGALSAHETAVPPRTAAPTPKAMARPPTRPMNQLARIESSVNLKIS